jgi:hypothetical protein
MHRRSATILVMGLVLSACSGDGGWRFRETSVLQFSSTTFTLPESGGSALISVQRVGSPSGTVRVDYSTSDGSATAPDDYSPASGTLVWADGDTGDKMISVPLVDDGLYEGSETVELLLRDPGGRSRLGSPSIATLVILDDDCLPGALDLHFGSNGVVRSDPSAYPDRPYAMTADVAHLFIVGWDHLPGQAQWRIEKRSLLDGLLDPGFGTGGFVSSDPSIADDAASDVALDSSFLYVAGVDASDGFPELLWRVEKRRAGDGSRVTGFGSSGTVITDPGGGLATVPRILVDGQHLYLVGGTDLGTDSQWRIEKRSLQDGALDPGFGTSGVVTTNPAGVDMVHDVALGGASLYLVGQDDGPGDLQWRMERRSTVDGSLDPSFGTSGVVVSNPSPEPDSAEALAIDSSHLYVAGYEDGGGTLPWRIEKRSRLDGSLEPAFGTGGIVTSDPSPLWDRPRGIAVDPPHLYVTGTDRTFGNLDWQWRTERRSSVDGSLDLDFGTGGVVTRNPTVNAEDEPWDILVGTSSIYILGYHWQGQAEWAIEKRCD